MAGPEGLMIGESGIDMEGLGIGKGSGKAGEAEIEREQEAARVFNMLSHDEGWWHAIKANPKALLWCEYRCICDNCASIADIVQ